MNTAYGKLLARLQSVRTLGVSFGLDRVRLALERLGWPPDDRPFAAHLTLARTDGVPGSDEKARRLIELARDVRLAWLADSMVLYKSNLGRGPPHYEALSEARLGD